MLESILLKYKSSFSKVKPASLIFLDCVQKLGLSCCCIPQVWVSLEKEHVEAESKILFQWKNLELMKIDPKHWLNNKRSLDILTYTYWLDCALKSRYLKVHPLDVHAFFKGVDIHPSYRIEAKRDFGNLSLMSSSSR